MMDPEFYEKRRVNAIGTQMSSSNGREFVAMLLEDNFWGQTLILPNALGLAHNVGRQTCANDLYRMCEAQQPEQTAMMLKEWRERRDQIDEGITNDS